MSRNAATSGDVGGVGGPEGRSVPSTVGPRGCTVYARGPAGAEWALARTPLLVAASQRTLQPVERWH
jgi:hypothetical protein